MINQLKNFYFPTVKIVISHITQPPNLFIPGKKYGVQIIYWYSLAKNH